MVLLEPIPTAIRDYWLRIFVRFLCTIIQIKGEYRKLGHDGFISHSLWFIINSLPILGGRWVGGEGASTLLEPSPPKCRGFWITYKHPIAFSERVITPSQRSPRTHHTTNTTDEHIRSHRVSNSLSQWSSGRRLKPHTAQPPGLSFTLFLYST